MTESDPPRAFDDSRRLLGPSRWLAAPGVVLEARGPAARDAAAQAGWAARVRAVAAVLGWPDPQPAVAAGASGVTLAFAAPDGALLAATELNEWSWERAADARAPLAAQGLVPAQTTDDDPAAVAARVQALAAHEHSRPLQRLRAAAAAHGLPLLADDDSVSLGYGAGSRTWPRAALPLPLDVPWSTLHAVPAVLVTGSNGKTTTTRLLAAMAARAGLTPGLSSTEGVTVDGVHRHVGDWAGPAGARAVLRDPAVRFAVLETARGGLLRRGLVVPRADAAVVVNVSADHFGEYGIDSVEDIAEAKLVVAHALREGGTLVLNGGDAVLMAVAARTPAVQALQAAGRLALFAPDADHPALAGWHARGGTICGVRGGRLWRAGRDGTADLGAVAAMPLTLGGAAPHNTENIAAAVLCAHAAGLPDDAVRATLAAFGADPADNPGRLERHAHRGATVLVDYAHNPDGLARLLAVARTLLAPGARLLLLLGQAGNRDDDAIAALARTAAAARPDRVAVKELPGMLRGRAPGEVPALLQRALRAAGQPDDSVTRVDDEDAACAALLAAAGPGDVVVLPVHTGAVRERLVGLLAPR